MPITKFEITPQICYSINVATKKSKESKKLALAVVSKMVTLSTAGLGLVAALSWNNVIKELVDRYVQPLVGGVSGVFSLLIYAILVTIMAVVVTMQLTKLEEKLKK